MFQRGDRMARDYHAVDRFFDTFALFLASDADESSKVFGNYILIDVVGYQILDFTHFECFILFDCF